MASHCGTAPLRYIGGGREVSGRPAPDAPPTGARRPWQVAVVIPHVGQPSETDGGLNLVPRSSTCASQGPGLSQEDLAPYTPEPTASSKHLRPAYLS